MALRQTHGFVPVVAALVGNTAIAGAKFAAAFVSGSSVMFSEAIHSVADTLNQVLLLIGVARSTKKADDVYEYGYGNERFFWALISACGVFFVGAGVTAYEGFHALANEPNLEFNIAVVLVLAFSLITESYTFFIAVREIARTFPEVPWKERFARSDPSTLAVFLEDAVAVLGILVASITIALTYLTGSSVYDAAGSLIIAALLGGMAISLIFKNRAYIIGKSMPEEMQREVMEMLSEDPTIERVLDFKSSTVGWNVYRIKCEVEFNGAALAREAEGGSMKHDYEYAQENIESFKRYAAEYADRIPRLMGRKIDELEKLIKARFPTIRHIDIEVN